MAFSPVIAVLLPSDANSASCHLLSTPLVIGKKGGWAGKKGTHWTGRQGLMGLKKGTLGPHRMKLMGQK